MRKVLIGGILVALAMMVIPVFVASIHQATSPSGAVFADDNAKSAENTPNVANPQQAAQPEKMPSALPVNELPLYPGQDSIFIAVKKYGDDGDAAIVDVIVNGYKEAMHVRYGKAEELVSFRLRTDGWAHTSVQFFGKNPHSDTAFTSATILVPDEESLKL